MLKRQTITLTANTNLARGDVLHFSNGSMWDVISVHGATIQARRRPWWKTIWPTLWPFRFRGFWRRVWAR